MGEFVNSARLKVAGWLITGLIIGLNLILVYLNLV